MITPPLRKRKRHILGPARNETVAICVFWVFFLMLYQVLQLFAMTVFMLRNARRNLPRPSRRPTPHLKNGVESVLGEWGVAERDESEHINTSGYKGRCVSQKLRLGSDGDAFSHLQQGSVAACPSPSASTLTWLEKGRAGPGVNTSELGWAGNHLPSPLTAATIFPQRFRGVTIFPPGEEKKNPPFQPLYDGRIMSPEREPSFSMSVPLGHIDIHKVLNFAGKNTIFPAPPASITGRDADSLQSKESIGGLLEMQAQL